MPDYLSISFLGTMGTSYNSAVKGLWGRTMKYLIITNR